MAKNYFLLALLFLAYASSAQLKIGIMGGPQTASILEKNNIPGWDTSTGKYYSAKSGIHIGVTAEIPLGSHSHFYFQPSVLYSEKGRKFSKIFEASSADSFYSYNNIQTLNIQYIDIPLNLGYKLPLNHKKTTSFMVAAGPYISLFYNGKNTINQNDQYSSSTQSRNIVINKTEELQVGKKDNSYRTFGYGLNARAGFELGNVTLTGFYSQGLDNLYYSSYGGTFRHKVMGASLGIWLGQTKGTPVVKDKDGDGIPDDKDACPLQPGTTIANGCPDRDGDGIADNRDKCPDLPGTVKYEGCPIPDTDKDGINDELDKCPLQPGTAQYNGCPVPDRDNDGINDEADKCPDTPGVPENNGCPVKEDTKLIKEDISKEVRFAAKNIVFAHNSTILLKKSFSSLNTVIELLKKNPSQRLSIHGYTDNTGTAAANLVVSAKRAQRVKDYLVARGIAENRITTQGHGQEDPVASNQTEGGRNKNRRVELRLEHD